MTAESSDDTQQSMDQVQPEKLSLTSEDITARRAAELRALFPEAFSENRLDLDNLKSALGDVADPQDGREPYGLIWPGKVDAIRAIQSPSIGTLKPDRDRSLNFDSTGNVFIEGDNLEVLKLLQKSYYGRVKMIYIDPPYNTGKEFIYPDKFKEGLRDYLDFSKQVRDGVRLSSNAETEGRFHSNWLSMMYPRLFLGKQLLREDGFIVVSIDDAEVHNLRAMLNEAMGEENFIACLVWDRNRKNDAKFFSVGHEYMLIYAKNKSYLIENKVILRVEKEGVDEVRKRFDELRAEHGEDFAAIQAALRDFYKSIDEEDPRFPITRFNKVDAKGPYRDDGNPSWPGSGGPTYPVLHPVTGLPCKLPSRGWVFPTIERMNKAIADGRVVFGPDDSTVPAIRTNLFDKTTQVMKSVEFSYAQTASREFDKLFDKKRVFDNPKHYADLARLIEYLTGEDDLVVDYFAGSASIGHAVYDVNSRTGSRRTFICVQLPEPVNEKKTSGKNALAIGLKTIADVGRARLVKVIEQERTAANGALHGNGGADLGFKYLTLDSSNFRIWDNEEAGAEGAKGGMSLMEYMAEHVNNVLPSASEESILFEILIKSGTDLAARREVVEVAGRRIWRINGGALIVCLADSVTLDTMRGVATLDPKPRRVICLDRCFAGDDALKTNTVLEMRSHEIHFLTV